MKPTTKLTHIATVGKDSARAINHILTKLLKCEVIFCHRQGSNLVEVHIAPKSARHEKLCKTAIAAIMRQTAIASSINSGSAS